MPRSCKRWPTFLVNAVMYLLECLHDPLLVEFIRDSLNSGQSFPSISLLNTDVNESLAGSTNLRVVRCISEGVCGQEWANTYHPTNIHTRTTILLNDKVHTDTPKQVLDSWCRGHQTLVTKSLQIVRTWVSEAKAKPNSKPRSSKSSRDVWTIAIARWPA